MGTCRLSCTAHRRLTVPPDAASSRSKTGAGARSPNSTLVEDDPEHAHPTAVVASRSPLSPSQARVWHQPQASVEAAIYASAACVDLQPCTAAPLHRCTALAQLGPELPVRRRGHVSFVVSLVPGSGSGKGKQRRKTHGARPARLHIRTKCRRRHAPTPKRPVKAPYTCRHSVRVYVLYVPRPCAELDTVFRLHPNASSPKYSIHGPCQHVIPAQRVDLIHVPAGVGNKHHVWRCIHHHSHPPPQTRSPPGRPSPTVSSWSW